MGKGNVLGIQAVYKTMTIEEEYIDDVDPGVKILIQRNTSLNYATHIISPAN